MQPKENEYLTDFASHPTPCTCSVAKLFLRMLTVMLILSIGSNGSNDTWACLSSLSGGKFGYVLVLSQKCLLICFLCNSFAGIMKLFGWLHGNTNCCASTLLYHATCMCLLKYSTVFKVFLSIFLLVKSSSCCCCLSRENGILCSGFRFCQYLISFVMYNI